MTNDTMTRRVTHPMVRLQRQVQSIVDSRKLQPTDGLWKVGFLFRDTRPQWKEELLDFDYFYI